MPPPMMGMGAMTGSSRSMPPPPDDDSPLAPGPPKPEEPEEGGQGNIESAGVIRASDHCSACENYQSDGSCSKLAGQFDPEDACLKYFEAKSGAEEPDEDDDSPMPAPDSAPSTPPSE